MRSLLWATTFLSAVTAMVFGATTPVYATPISGVAGFGDPTVDPALAGGTVINFDAGPVGDFGSITFGNVTFIGTDAPVTIGTDFNGSFNTRGVNSLFNGFDFIPTEFEFVFGSQVSAFGFLWGASDKTWRLSAFDTGGGLIEFLDILPLNASNAGDYFGIAASGIASATLQNLESGDFVFIDSFTFIPEPSTALLLGFGLLGLAARGRRRKT